MPTIQIFKMPFKTHHFREGQKVWVLFLSGDQAVQCAGKFRGYGRYVCAWVNWTSNAKPMPEIRTIEIDQDFHDRLMALAEEPSR